MRRRINDSKQVMLLDGYNVIHRLPEIPSHKGTSLEERRNALAVFIVRWKSARKYKGTVYLVFDGQEGRTTTLEQSVLHGIKCIYSRQKEEADGKIIGIIRSASHPEHITVISDDNYIANNVRSFGAHIKPVAYLSEVKKTGKPRGVNTSKKNIDAATAHHITNHMKQIWGITD